MPEQVRSAIEQVAGKLAATSMVGGGCIANATRIETATGLFFLKWGSGSVAATFRAEAKGLKVLRAGKHPLLVPTVFHVDDQCLLLEWIEQGSATAASWATLGRGLATMHQSIGTGYGFEADNFIGRTVQHNDWVDSWPEFFILRRLRPQRRLAERTGLWKRDWDRRFDRLCTRLSEMLPGRPLASLLHGDLWGGNQLVSAEGRPVLIDPAVYYGHAETDLAMTELFGGFQSHFYAAYDEVSPRSPDYPDRREVYNLYHLMNHLNLFGSSYAGSVQRILQRFG